MGKNVVREFLLLILLLDQILTSGGEIDGVYLPGMGNARRPSNKSDYRALDLQ